MESNIKTVELCTEKCIFEKEVEVFLESEFALPEYYSPIKRTLHCRFEPAVSSKNLTGSTINIDGVASIKLIYCDDMNEPCCFESGLVFNKNLDTGFDIEKCSIKADVVDCKTNYSVKSDRKFEIKASVTLKICVSQLTKSKCLSGVADKSFEQKCYSVPVKEDVKFAEKNIIIDDELELSESHAKIGRILNYDGIILPDECKLMNGKVMIKGNLVLNITYLSADGCIPCRLQHKTPYSQVCDVDGINDEFTCNCSEKLVYVEVKCRNSGNDQSRSISINAKLCVELEAYLQKENTLISDIYSLHNKIEISSNTMNIKCLKDRLSEVFTVKKTLEFSEGSIGSVTDIWSKVKITGVSKKENYVLIFGIAYIKMIICDVNGNAEFIERAIDFEYKYNATYTLNSCVAEAKAFFSNMSYIVVSENAIEVTCNLSMNINIFEIREVNVVSDMTVLEGNTEDCIDCSMYVCYLEAETDLWELAKSHRSSLKRIREINGLDEAQNTISGSILIPTV